jgi:hypothetical protein
MSEYCLSTLDTFMKSITSYLDFTVTLQQSSAWKSFYELRFGDELLGTINMPKLFSERAEAASADGVWSFERQGLFKPKIIARMQNGTIVASYQPRFFKQGGTLTIVEKEVLNVKLGLFRNTLDIYYRFDERIIHFQNYGTFRHRSEITFSRSVKHVQQFPLIVFLSCYILLTAQRDATRSAAM